MNLMRSSVTSEKRFTDFICEILDNLLVVKSHLEERFQNQNEAIASEITTLKREICRHLIEEKMCLSNQYQE